MTKERENEILRKNFYLNLDFIVHHIKECEDSQVAFRIGLKIGKMLRDFELEPDKEMEGENAK